MLEKLKEYIVTKIWSWSFPGFVAVLFPSPDPRERYMYILRMVHREAFKQYMATIEKTTSPPENPSSSAFTRAVENTVINELNKNSSVCRK